MTDWLMPEWVNAGMGIHWPVKTSIFRRSKYAPLYKKQLEILRFWVIHEITLSRTGKKLLYWPIFFFDSCLKLNSSVSNNIGHQHQLLNIERWTIILLDYQKILIPLHPYFSTRQCSSEAKIKYFKSSREKAALYFVEEFLSPFCHYLSSNLSASFHMVQNEPASPREHILSMSETIL